LYPFLRRFFTSIKIYFISMGMAIAGYISLLVLASTSMNNVFLLFIPGFFIFAANGMLAVITTVFLANTVDYGELKNFRRDESVIFSMQTFVVKLASGISGFMSSMVLAIFSINPDKEATVVKAISDSQRFGLRFTMTLIPITVLAIGAVVFKKRYVLFDSKMNEITEEIESRKASA
ncbi:MAG: MFS transporter, partial [Pseudobutyrivibrio sp.]|nr:MFS transporter [Pseudobutyrivibrio sp.]